MTLNNEEIKALIEKCRHFENENLQLRKLLNIDSISPIPIQDIKIQSDIDITNESKLTTDEKIKLYRLLFRGRDDIFATRWESKDGRAGYSPACENEWDRRVCRKPKIKCSECPHSKWLPITDQIIHDHLTGKRFIGVYPLLKDETCHFLAIDFDKSAWQEDAMAFINVCRSHSIPVVLERSQSGNGAHVWIFFAERIAARSARLLGTGLLTQTMRERHTVSMESYDRLFPNQDTLPKGGFGNLIALPLQGDRRKKGNSTFLNDALEPHPNPWGLLSSIRPLTLQSVISLIEKLSEQGGLLDVRSTQSEDEHLDPWIASKSVPIYPEITGHLPPTIEIVLANMLYVPYLALPSNLINQIKKIASFQNPEFYRAQAMRLSTYGKPRVINCADEFTNYIALPRGCQNELIKLLNHYNITVNFRDETVTGKDLVIEFQGKLRPEQQKALISLLPHRYGILAATTAFGKTVIAAKMIAERKRNTLVLVHRQQLLDQWKERLSSLFDIPSDSIGMLGAGRKKLTGHIDVAMLQSLSKKGVVNEEITQYGQIIVDECHHLSAFSFEQVLKKARAHYVLGLTATPTRKDGHHPIIMMQCGPIHHQVSSKSQIVASQIKHRVLVRRTSFHYPSTNAIPKISDLYSELANDSERNEHIFNDVLLALENKRVPLLLTERVQHLQWLADKLNKFVKNIFILQGGMKSSSRQAALKTLLNLPENEERIILATGKYIGEGFDDPRLDTLFLALPISWQGTLQQYVGRLHRKHQHKTDILVYDYVDANVPMLHKMYKKRLKKYLAMGYIMEDKPHD